MKFDSEITGSKVLEALTNGIYDGNSNCIKEYVQNAIDSKSKKVEIYHQNKELDLVIRDYGEGMDKEKLIQALKIGYSEKGKMVDEHLK